MKKAIPVILVFMCLCVILSGCNSSTYEDATNLMEQGKYQKALDLFNEISTYEDASAKAAECKSHLEYQDAVDLMEQGNYQDAITLFSELDNFEDSAAKANECQCYLDYQNAVDLMERGNYQDALNLFDKLATYEDSSTKAVECTYQLGIKAKDAEEWDTAISYFEGLNYENSEEWLEYCTKEQGMHENADYDFLAKLEESILNRMETTATDNFTSATLVNTELAYIGKFEDATFYDERLKKLALKYIDGLNIQKASLTKEYEYEHQIEWQRGMVYRYEVLCDLYNDYDFLSDNADFIGTYVSGYENQLALLNAYEAIEADLAAQLLAEDFSWTTDGNTLYCTLTNHTEYTYSTIFEISCYGSNQTLYETDSVRIDNIIPDSSYVVSVYISNIDKVENYIYQNYYTNVMIP